MLTDFGVLTKVNCFFGYPIPVDIIFLVRFRAGVRRDIRRQKSVQIVAGCYQTRSPAGNRGAPPISDAGKTGWNNGPYAIFHVADLPPGGWSTAIRYWSVAGAYHPRLPRFRWGQFLPEPIDRWCPLLPIRQQRRPRAG